MDLAVHAFRLLLVVNRMLPSTNYERNPAKSLRGAGFLMSHTPRGGVGVIKVRLNPPLAETLRGGARPRVGVLLAVMRHLLMPENEIKPTTSRKLSGQH